MEKRGHQVELRTANAVFSKLPAPRSFKKWLGYIDQFILFPFRLKLKLRNDLEDCLYVFTDHALGSWVPLVANRKHVIHCHDFLAQQSALGLLPENSIGKTGKIYQTFIRRGYRKGKNFICISKKTQQDLLAMLASKPQLSAVVYNGLNQDFSPADPLQVRDKLGKILKLNLQSGYILHVGGNQFYKNRKGVLAIYEAWRSISKATIPLLCIGFAPNENLKVQKSDSQFESDIHFISDLDDKSLQLAYQGASTLLYPSLAEGFGWPIAEAMASGCPVITTGEAPMSEVGGDAAYYIKKAPLDVDANKQWAKESAQVLETLIQLEPSEREKLIKRGQINSERFDTDRSLDAIEAIYQQVTNS